MRKPLSALIAMTTTALLCAPSLKSEAKTSPETPTTPPANSLERRVEKVKSHYLTAQEYTCNQETGEIQKFSWGNWGNGGHCGNEGGHWGKWNKHCWTNWNDWNNHPHRGGFWVNI